jgi:ATP-dependent DNA helicase RecQ
MHDLQTDLAKALEIMGYDAPRKGQEPILEELLYGNNDIISVAPTGHGKTATLVLPALARDWRCLVVSPLIALQNDQVQKLVNRGVTAAAINSGMNEEFIRLVSSGWLQGHLQFLYVAPERLETEAFKRLMAGRRPDLLVVDEVHTAAMWGDDFRPAYHRIGQTIELLRPVRVLCLTATLTEENEADVRRILHLEKAVRLTYYERRENLRFLTLSGNDLGTIGQQLNRSTGATIVYASTVRRIDDELFPGLVGRFGAESGVVRYHGQLEHTERQLAQQLFMTGKARIVVATNAFGLGIDKQDIRSVIHADVPGSIEAYIQEAGRAGRDGEPSTCALGYDYRSVGTQLFFSKCRNPDRATFSRVWNYLQRIIRNSGGSTNKTVEEMARESGVLEPMLATCLNVLKAAGLLEREAGSPMYSIQLAREQPALDDSIKELRDTLVRLADIERTVKMRAKPLASALALDQGVKDLDRRLRQLQEQGVLQFTPPLRGKRTRLCGDSLEKIDWARLTRKARRESRQLSQMILFASIPDDQKHEAAEAYFAKGTIPEELRPRRLLNEVDNIDETDDDDPQLTEGAKACGE